MSWVLMCVGWYSGLNHFEANVGGEIIFNNSKLAQMSSVHIIIIIII